MVAHVKNSPETVGQATTAKEQGQGFFEIQLEVGSSQREVAMFRFKTSVVGRTAYLNSIKGENKTHTHAGTLAAIEAVGWRPEHAGYVFVVAEESSRRKLQKEQTAVSGDTAGIYLFRNID